MKHARSISISAAILAGLVLVGSVIWLTTPQSEPFYTDAATIRASQDIARLRDVLWQPPKQLGAPAGRNCTNLCARRGAGLNPKR